MTPSCYLFGFFWDLVVDETFIKAWIQSLRQHRLSLTEESHSASSLFPPKYMYMLSRFNCVWLFCDPIDCSLPGFSVHGVLQVRILEWVAIPFSRRSSQSRDRTHVSHIAGGFFTSWATKKPKNIGVGSLSLFQWIFPTQELNQALLHCRWIFHQLSYLGSPFHGSLR